MLIRGRSPGLADRHRRHTHHGAEQESGEGADQQGCP
jgi:hypothetical protein